MSAVPRAPDGLSARAKAFWRDVHEVRTLGLLEHELVVEAVRLMTRADQLDVRLRKLAGGDEWRSLLTEARLTATALRGVMAELRAHTVGPAAPAEGQGPVAEEDPLDELGAKRKDRLAGPSGF